MSFFVGLVEAAAGGPAADGVGRVRAIADSHGGTGEVRSWRGDGAAVAQVSQAVTPEDRFDRLPGHFAGGQSVLLFDGRLDNRADLLRELDILPGQSASLGDGALVMAAVEHWGEDACGHLIGDFALGWWDDARRRLMLACDAAGGRTVYFHVGTRGLFFATRPLALHGFPEVPRAVDRQTMAYLLLRQTQPADRSHYQDIFRLPAAGRLLWTPMGHRVDRYWRLDWSRRIRFRHDDDYVAAGREMLNKVVSAQLRMLGPVVCQLSGGLDSPAVTATAARLLTPAPLHTITTTPDPAARLPAEPAKLVFDEWPLAARVAALYPNITAHHAPSGALTLHERDPIRAFQGFGQPVRNLLNFGGFRRGFELARELGAKVLLTGLAGNVTLSWQSAALPAEMLVSGDLAGLARQIVGLRREGGGWMEILRRQLAAPLAPLRLKQVWRELSPRPTEFWKRYSAITPEFAAEMDAMAISEGFWAPLDAPGPDSRARQRFFEEHWSRRQFMAAHPYVSGCELRDPLGDRRMVEFCLAIPAEQWQLKGIPRSFARRVLADRVPSEVTESRRVGYQGADWFHRLDGLREVMAEEVDRLENSAAVRQMIDIPRLRALLDDWPADADAAQSRFGPMQSALHRGLQYARFIHWIEGSN